MLRLVRRPRRPGRRPRRRTRRRRGRGGRRAAQHGAARHRFDPARAQDRHRAERRQRVGVELQQERALSRARDRCGRPGGQRHSAARHADAARSRRSTPTRRSTSGWRGRRKAMRSPRSRATTIAAGASGSTPSSGSPASGQSGDPKKVELRPGERHVVPEEHEHQRQPRAAVHRDAGRAHLRHRESHEGRAARRGRNGGAGANPTSDGPGAAGGAARRQPTTPAPIGRTSSSGTTRIRACSRSSRCRSRQDRNFNYATMFRLDDKKLVRLADEESPTVNVTGRGRWAIGTNDDPYELQGNLDGIRRAGHLRHRHEDRQEDRDQEGPALGQHRVAGHDEVSLLRREELLRLRHGHRHRAQHHGGRADVVRGHRRRPQRRRSADERRGLDVG